MIIPIILGMVAAAAATEPSTTLRIPKRAEQHLRSFVRWAKERAIPLDVFLAWASLESGFNPREYNPEKGAMLRWAKEIVGKPERWGDNPDYGNAARALDILTAGGTPDDVVAKNLWSFGSWGMIQVSRITAAEIGVLPYRKSNALLWDVDLNLKAASLKISRSRAKLFPGTTTLTDSEWALVRAAYVMGDTGARDPGKQEGVEEKKAKFYVALQQIRGPRVEV